MYEEGELINVAIHPSLTSPVMIAGAERELTMLLGFMAVAVWMAGKDFVFFVLGLAIWFIGIFFARLAAKVDSQLIRTMIRHFKYQDYYPAAEPMEAH